MDTAKTTMPGVDETQGHKIFVPLPERPQGAYTGANSSTSEDFKSRAKAFEPAAGAIWNIPSSIGVKVLRNRLLAVTEEDEADAIAEKARISPESLTAAKQATARIFARHNLPEDVADGGILVGVACELAHGFWDCLQAVRDLEKKLLAKQNKEKSKAA